MQNDFSWEKQYQIFKTQSFNCTLHIPVGQHFVKSMWETIILFKVSPHPPQLTGGVSFTAEVEFEFTT